MAADPAASFVLVALQAAVLVLLAPLLTGTIRRTKARLQSRRGASVWQPYRDLRKWWTKESVQSSTASPIQGIAPAVVLAVTVSALLLVPTVAFAVPLPGWGDLIAVVGLLAAARFTVALAALDSGSAFGGMGSSRDVSVAALIEPAFVLALIVAAVTFGSTDLGTIAGSGAALGLSLLTPAHVIAAVAFAIVVVADSGHLPVDHPDTHLELTMVHEGMLLEASGRRLALYMLSAHLRQALLIALFLAVFVPWGMAGEIAALPLAVGAGVFVVKVLVAGQGLALADAVVPKLRILRLPQFMGVATALALVALAARVWLPA